MNHINRKYIALAFIIMVFSGAAAIIGLETLHYSGSTGFCISCHEMRVVAEQGWMNSPHYMSQHGVAAECGHCHIPPENEIFRMMWVKGRDGTKDVFVHLFGESEPHKMDWDSLEKSARAKIHDSSCAACHSNITAKGFPTKAIIAHREYERLKNTSSERRCVDCHTEEFHGEFKRCLFEKNLTAMNGGKK